MNNRLMMEPELRLPKPPHVSIMPGAFVLCAASANLSVDQWYWQQFVYQQAYERAQAIVRPSLLERDLLGVWN